MMLKYINGGNNDVDGRTGCDDNNDDELEAMS